MLCLVLSSEAFSSSEIILSSNSPPIPLPAFDLGSLGDLAPSLSNFAPTLVEARPITIREGYLIFDGGLEGSVPVGGF